MFHSYRIKLIREKKETYSYFFSSTRRFQRIVYLSASLLIRVLMLDAVNLLAVTLQRASLRETLLAEEALVGSHTCVRPRMPLEVERVVEALPAECTQVALHVTVTLHVTIEKPL